MADYGGFSEVWNRYFDASAPTRKTVAVHQLPDPGLAIELKAIAALGSAGRGSRLGSPRLGGLGWVPALGDGRVQVGDERSGGAACAEGEMAAGGSASQVPLLVEREDAVETLVINDAPRNRMRLEFMDALEAEVGRLANDPSVRAVVIRGAGEEHFSVGMDLKQLPDGVARMGSVEAVFDQRLRVLGAIENLPKPVVAVLYGYCLGGGLELPLACHFRLAAAEGARIGLPELELGTVPAWGGSARLTRCVGRAHALDMILRAKTISGPEALRIGLVNEVWPIGELFERAAELARELAEMPAIAVRGMLRCIVGAEERSLAENIAEERRVVLSTMGTPDQREGMRAFLEKRRPRFNRESE